MEHTKRSEKSSRFTASDNGAGNDFYAHRDTLEFYHRTFAELKRFGASSLSDIDRDDRGRDFRDELPSSIE